MTAMPTDNQSSIDDVEAEEAAKDAAVQQRTMRDMNIGHAAQRKPDQFWSALTSSQQVALLLAAPKVAKAWQDEPEAEFPNAMARRTPDGECIADVFRETKTAQPRWIVSGFACRDGQSRSGEPASLEDGRAACDALLRTQGWVLE